MILDSHVEVVAGWLEPLVTRIQQKPHSIVMPAIDGIDPSTWEPIPGGIGCVLGKARLLSGLVLHIIVRG